jgi:integrase
LTGGQNHDEVGYAMKIRKLNIKQVENAKGREKPYMLSDGGNLYLRVRPGEFKSWIFRYTRKGKPAETGLGSAVTVSLKTARKKATALRELATMGVDLVEAKRAAAILAAPKPTFGECADSLIKAKQSEWSNAKHRLQWRVTLSTHAAALRAMPVDEVGTAAVLSVLQPLWQRAPETASRLRGRIEMVLDAARARGFIAADKANPARWKGHLDKLLAKRTARSRGHYEAMPYAEVPAFLAKLREQDNMASLALQFLVLTAARSGEVLGARWAEFDLGAKVWTTPATRMKAGREHRVPLSAPALAILEELAAIRTGDLVFASSNSALRRLVPGGVTIHGFRSAFRDWCGNETSFPREIAEAALAHVSGDATERAYRRGDALEKRRGLMEAWAAFCGAGSNVLQLRQVV